MTDDLTELEKAVLDQALAGNHPVLEALRQQRSAVRVIGRRNTGVGFFADLHVSESVPPAQTSPKRVHIDDVTASIPGLEHGAGFVLLVEDGYLAMLEGFSFDEPWPAQVADWHLGYSSGDRRDVTKLAL